MVYYTIPLSISFHTYLPHTSSSTSPPPHTSPLPLLPIDLIHTFFFWSKPWWPFSSANSPICVLLVMSWIEGLSWIEEMLQICCPWVESFTFFFLEPKKKPSNNIPIRGINRKSFGPDSVPQ
jgi:hypothetical protein